MGVKLKLHIHPLFLIAGIVSAFTGDLLLFLLATIAAIEHECAHAFAAKRAGFSLDKIVLMPYGAVISGDISGIPPKKELIVCAAGPLANGLTALGFTALWWLYPETYPYTDVAAQVSLSLFLVNLLPAYPLDGGRILRIALRRLGSRKEKIFSVLVSVLISLALLAYFVVTCFQAPKFNVLFFALCIALGGLGGGNYTRIRFSRKKSFLRGVEERRIAISADCSLSDAICFLREDKYLVLILFDGEEFFAELPEEELLRAVEKNSLTLPLREAMFEKSL